MSARVAAPPPQPAYRLTSSTSVAAVATHARQVRHACTIGARRSDAYTRATATATSSSSSWRQPAGHLRSVRWSSWRRRISRWLRAVLAENCRLSVSACHRRRVEAIARRGLAALSRASPDHPCRARAANHPCSARAVARMSPWRAAARMRSHCSRRSTLMWFHSDSVRVSVRCSADCRIWMTLCFTSSTVAAARGLSIDEAVGWLPATTPVVLLRCTVAVGKDLVRSTLPDENSLSSMSCRRAVQGRAHLDRAPHSVRNSRRTGCFNTCSRENQSSRTTKRKWRSLPLVPQVVTVGCQVFAERVLLGGSMSESVGIPCSLRLPQRLLLARRALRPAA